MKAYKELGRALMMPFEPYAERTRCLEEEWLRHRSDRVEEESKQIGKEICEAGRERARLRLPVEAGSDYRSRMQYMWADTLLTAERAHILRLFAWGATSAVTGTAIVAWLRRRAGQSPLLLQFGLQTMGWGLVEVALAVFASRGLALRDLAGATRLDRFLWLNIGLDVGYVLVGASILVTGWQIARRSGLVGAGVGVIVQGSALVLLDLTLAVHISR